MTKIEADKKLIEMLESYDYEYCGNFKYEFHFDKDVYGTSLTIIMLDGCEDNDREFAYRVAMHLFPDSGAVGFELDTGGYAILMSELEFFSDIAYDRKEIMDIYNSIEED